MQKITAGVIFLALVVLCSAGSPYQVLYPFDINNLLDEGQCIDDLGRPIDDLGRPTGQPTVPLSPVEMNDGAFESRTLNNETVNVTYQLWLPQPSGFRSPSLAGVDTNRLLTFLGAHFNERLTSVNLPQRPPERACDLLPTAESLREGQPRMHMEEVDEEISILSLNPERNRRMFVDVNNEISGLEQGRYVIPNAWDEFRLLENAQVIFEANALDFLWDLWIAKCPLTPRWVQLDQSYFPRYMSTSVCSQKNCSIPIGLTCQEDFLNTVTVTVLRWDCCYVRYPEMKEPRWECGWRKVQVPIFCDCTCNCNEVYTPLDRQ